MGIILPCTPAAEIPTDLLHRLDEDSSEKTLLGYLKDQSFRLIALGVLYFLIVLATLSVPFLIVLIYRSLWSSDASVSVTTIAAALIALLFVRFIFEFLRSRLLITISARTSEAMILDFFSKIFGFSILQFSQRKFGDYMMKLTAYERIRTQMKNASFYVIFDVITLVSAAGLLALVEPNVAVVYVATLFVIIAIALAGLPRARLLRFQGYNIQSVTHTMESDILRGMQDIKASQCEGHFRRTWNRQTRESHAVDDALIDLRELQRNASALALSLCTVASIVILVRAVTTEIIDFPDLLFVMIVLGFASVPTIQFAEFIRSVDDLLFYIAQLRDIHDMFGQQKNRQYPTSSAHPCPSTAKSPKAYNSARCLSGIPPRVRAMYLPTCR